MLFTVKLCSSTAKKKKKKKINFAVISLHVMYVTSHLGQNPSYCKVIVRQIYKLQNYILKKFWSTVNRCFNYPNS